MKPIATGLKEEDRKNISEGLSRLLADSYTLYLKTHNFHWNVKGPMFQTLHSMFETEYNELAQAVDVIAERIRSLGMNAPGTYQEFSTLTSIKEHVGPLTAKEMIYQLIDGHESVVRTARALLPFTEEAVDEVSAGLITARMETHEKTAWMLRSMLEE